MASVLRSFGNFLHEELQIEANNGGHTYVIVESDIYSGIRELRLMFDNKDDVLILRHDLQRLDKISRYFRYPFKGRTSSCDFVVLINDESRGLVLCFCEVKTSLSAGTGGRPSTEDHAMRQIRCTEVFFEYLLRSYLLSRSGESSGLKISQDRILRFLIHCSDDKAKTSAFDFDKNLWRVCIRSRVKGSIATIPNAYEFFIDKL